MELGEEKGPNMNIYSETNAEIGPELSASPTWTSWRLSKPRTMVLTINFPVIPVVGLVDG